MAGQILYLNAQNQWTRLDIGAEDRILVVGANGLPSWIAPSMIPAAADADLSAQTVGTIVILGSTVVLGSELQTIINAIVTDINDLKAKLRTAGVLQT